MKREIKETKKNLNSKPKAKISDVKTLTKKSSADKAEKKSVVEINLKAKKNIKISAQPVKQSAEKKPAANKLKTGKQAAATINPEKKPAVKKSSLKTSVNTKEKVSKPKAPKKPVVETKIKKEALIKKSPVAKQIVKTKPQIKAVVKNEQPLAKKKSETVSRNSKIKTQKKTADISKAEKPKVQKIKPIVSAEKSKASTLTAEPKVQKKATVNIKLDKPEAKKAKLQIKSEVSVKKVKMPEPQAVAEIKILPKKVVIKKAKPISSAVLRGKKGRYDFEVFPLDANFEAVSAIYVISKRITDKRKRGHHKLVCIGQTESIVDGIKMHKKDKCIKRNEANVICLLKEESEKNRLRIEADLREAHTIACNNQSVI